MRSERKPRALDLFCGGGGATRGLQMAGFHVTGIDIKRQPRYCGDAFIQGDATAPPVDLTGFDFIWASPPCQAYCALKVMPNARRHPELIAPMRDMLRNRGIPWVIENVYGSRLRAPLTLCGSMFGLGSNGFQLRRHRYFESSCPIRQTMRCEHAPLTLGVYGAKVRNIAQEKRHYSQDKATRGQPVEVVLPHRFAFEAMQIDWMNMDELSESIPPAYAEFIGAQALSAIDRKAAAMEAARV